MVTGTLIIGVSASCSGVAEIVTSFPSLVNCSTIVGVELTTSAVEVAVDVASLAEAEMPNGSVVVADESPPPVVVEVPVGDEVSGVEVATSETGRVTDSDVVAMVVGGGTSSTGVVFWLPVSLVVTFVPVSSAVASAVGVGVLRLLLSAESDEVSGVVTAGVAVVGSGVAAGVAVLVSVSAVVSVLGATASSAKLLRGKKPAQRKITSMTKNILMV